MSKHRSRKHKKFSNHNPENESKTTEVLVVEDSEDNVKVNQQAGKDVNEDEKHNGSEVEDKNCSEDIKDCEVAVLNYKTIPLFKNEPINISESSKSLMIKVPVIISEFVLNVNCEAEIKFKYPVYRIRDSKENVYLTRCKLIPKAHSLFFSGYVRKSIEYSATKNRRRKVNEGSLNHLTVDIPFEGVTDVVYATPPVFNTLNDKKEIISYYDNERWGKELDETSFKYSECLNEKIFCELVRADIFENEIVKHRECNELNTFNKVEEKLVLYLTLRLLQKQEIKIY